MDKYFKAHHLISFLMNLWIRSFYNCDTHVILTCRKYYAKHNPNQMILKYCAEVTIKILIL